MTYHTKSPDYISPAWPEPWTCSRLTPYSAQLSRADWERCKLMTHALLLLYEPKKLGYWQTSVASEGKA